MILGRGTLLLAITILVAPLAAEAQRTVYVPRIGLLCTVSCGGPDSPFMQGLRERGWREGQNIVVERREGTRDMLEQFASELVRLQVDVIVAFVTPATHAARKVTRTIPIVMAVYSGDPVGEGVIASLARPGGNITGLVGAVPRQQEKLFELIKEVVPRLSRLGHLWDLGFGPYPAQPVRTAKELKLEILPVPVRAPEDLQNAFQAVTKGHVQALLVPGHPLPFAHYRPIAEFALRNRLASISPWREFAEAGGLMTYWSSLPDLYRRSSIHVDKILRGANPSDLPVEQPTKFELVLNLKTAKALGLTIPPSVLLRADQVIE